MVDIQVRSDNDNEPFVLDATAEVRDGYTLAASQGALTQGAILGQVGNTSGGGTVGQYVHLDETATDGSQIPKLLLSEDTPNSTSSTTVSGYVGGLFDENQITFATTSGTLATQLTLSTNTAGTGVTYATVRDVLRSYNIRLAPGVSVSGPENS